MWCYPHPLLWTSSHSKEGEGGRGGEKEEVKWEEEVKSEEKGMGGMCYLHLLVVDLQSCKEEEGKEEEERRKGGGSK